MKARLVAGILERYPLDLAREVALKIPSEQCIVCFAPTALTL